jgi:hypothetical protein
MKDFETHDRGTAEELKLSRELAESIYQLINQYGEGIIPHSIQVPYKKLKEHYNKVIEMEKYQNGI